MATWGRQISTKTVLGQLMVQQGYNCHRMMIETGISYRILSDYLAPRRQPTMKDLVLLCTALDVGSDVLLEGNHWRLADPVAS